MSCESHREALLELALGATATAELTAHLAVCSRCSAAVEEQRRLLGRIDHEIWGTLDTEPSPELLSRIGERVARRASVAQPWLGGWLVPAASLGAALVLVLGALLTVRKADGPAPHAERASVEEPREEPAPRIEPPAPAAKPGARALRARRSPPAQPEVLVPPDQQRLLRRLVQALDEQASSMASPKATGHGPGVVRHIDVAPLLVMPLTIEPSDVRPLSIELDPLRPLALEANDVKPLAMEAKAGSVL